MESPTEYAGFWRRFCAVFLDGIIISIISWLVSLPFGLSQSILTSSDYSAFNPFALTGQLLGMVVSFGYPIYFIGKKGATPGKMICNIKVVKVDSNEPPGYTGAFLRESVGKLLSALALGIGYLWMIKDEKKQTWHDKIAGTVVICNKC